MFRWASDGAARCALPIRRMHLQLSAIAALTFLTATLAAGQTQGPVPHMPPDTEAPAQPVSPVPEQTAPPAPTQPPPAEAPQTTPPAAPSLPSTQEQAPLSQPPSMSSPPVAIVPLEASIPGAAATVAGAMEAWKGRAYITSSGSITAGSSTAQVTLPYRGTLRVCPSTTVKLSVDTSVPASEVPGLLIGLDGGAIEASFAIARNSDVVLTPNVRILIGGPGASEVKVRLGDGGDTCVDNSGANAPYVVVTSVFDSGLYRVQPGQRVMFEHGDLHTVVDDEKEPCGCPPSVQKDNEFPLAQSEGLAPPANQPPTTATNQAAPSGQAATTMVYNASGNQTAQLAPIPQPPTAQQASAAPTKQAAQKNPGFFSKVGRFFKRIFGAE
jgi:hypothetical protein